MSHRAAAKANSAARSAEGDPATRRLIVALTGASGGDMVKTDDGSGPALVGKAVKNALNVMHGLGLDRLIHQALG